MHFKKRFFGIKQRFGNVYPVVCAVLIVAIAHVVFMMFSGKTLLASNPYNSYTRQAMAWSQGQLYLPENYPWLELAIYKGHYYVSFPPFPSYLLFPFAVVFGENTPDSMIAFCVMLIGVLYAVRIAKQCGLRDWDSILAASFLYCANNVWMVTVDAWVWFFAQNLALTLTLMSFYYGLTGKFGRAFFFLAAAVGCRPFQILYSGIIVYRLFRKELNSRSNFVKLFLCRLYRFIPAALLGLSYMVLNFMRFGDPFEFGHNYLPEFIRAEEGQFSTTYLLENLPRLFELPRLDPSTKKVLFQEFNGTNFLIVFPIFLVLLLFFIKLIYAALKHHISCDKQEFLFLGISIGLVCIHILLLCTHRTLGGSHFGNRYIIDVLPALYLAVVTIFSVLLNNTAEEKLRQNRFEYMTFSVFYIFGLLINFAGVLNYYQ